MDYSATAKSKPTTFVLFIALVLILWAQEALPVNAQGVDLALAVNGSGSISSADFSLQKEGIKAAFRDPLIFPRDGSIGVTLVQYANGVTQVHIPYTVINNEADIARLVAQVDAIVQIQGSTNPGDGIIRSSQVLAASGNASSQRVICLSTDGLTNSGVSLGTAASIAKANGVKKLSVLAIEDPPVFFESDFIAHYGPHVFGGGAVTVVKNSTEFANILGLTCLGDPIELIGLEVTQAIQSWNNTVQVIEDKLTIVRAHVQTKDNQTAPASLRLRGFRNGVELSGSPRTADNASGFIAPMQAQNEQDIINRRNDMSKSLNFTLPTDWLNGTIELEVEGVGTGLDCLEAADTDDDCKVEVTFNETEQPEVKFVRVTWTETGGMVHTPTEGDVRELIDRLTAIYPIDGVTQIASAQHDAGTGEPNLGLLNLSLRLMRIGDGCLSIFGCDHLYYGVLRGPDLGGLALGLPGTVSSGTMIDATYGRNRHAHEIGHSLDRDHAVFDIQILPPEKVGVCGEVASILAEDFPYREMVSGFGESATIGPLSSGREAEIWGLDTHTNQSIDPRQYFELMSYCSKQDRWRWISDYTYNAIRDALNSRFSVTYPAAASRARATSGLLASRDALSAAKTGAIDDYFLVRGLIDFETDAVTFVPFATVSSAAQPLLPPAGNYTLQLLDAADNILEEISFEPEIIDVDFPAMAPNAGIFTLSTLADPAIQGVNVLKNGSFLSSMDASPNTPTVEVVFPNGGEVLSGNQVTLEWNASDLDGGPLTYLVQFSRDGGTTWETLATDLPNQTYDIPLAFLGETTQGLLRVMVSDGFNTSTDESDGTFITPNNPPDARILSPVDNTIFIGVQPIFFNARAFDREDGKLAGSSLMWTSSQDGFLGVGETFNLDATALSEGEHIIILTVTDAGGLTHVASVKISVFRLPPPSNRPPGADAGGDQTLECVAHDGATVTLDGSGSSDPDGDPITFTWREDGTIIAGPTSEAAVNITLSLGVHTIELTVDDGIAGTDTDEVEIIIEDTTPPILKVEAGRRRLWPPDLTYRKIKRSKFFSGVLDICDANISDDSVVITSVSSDEPEIGENDTPDDIIINGSCRKVKLRAERQQGGNGRVYTINLGVLDASGNLGTAAYQVYVPIEKKGGAIDDGPVYTVAGCTPAPSLLAQVQTLGSDTPAVSKTIEEVPPEFVLEQNYPNPFNPVSTIAFALPESRKVTLVIYDVLGRRVDTLVDRRMEAGRYEVTWDASRLPSGMYLYRITAGDFVQVKQMLLIK